MEVNHIIMSGLLGTMPARGKFNTVSSSIHDEI